MEIRNIYNDNTWTYETSFYDEGALLKAKKDTKEDLYKIAKEAYKKNIIWNLAELLEYVIDEKNKDNSNYKNKIQEIFKIQKDYEWDDELYLLMSMYFLYNENNFIKWLNTVINYKKNHKELWIHNWILEVYFDTILLRIGADKLKYLESEEMNLIITNFKEGFLAWINKELEKKDNSQKRIETLNKILEKYYK